MPGLYALILINGFFCGLPFSLIFTTLQAWFAISHQSSISIGALSLLWIPFATKFLWSPRLDIPLCAHWPVRSSWLCLTRALAGLCALGMACDSPNSTHSLALLAFLLAFFTASQDIVSDAYLYDIASVEHRATIMNLHVTGYRLGLLLSGGLGLVFAEYFGFHLLYLVGSSTLLLGAAFVWCLPRPQLSPTHHVSSPRKRESFLQWAQSLLRVDSRVRGNDKVRGNNSILISLWLLFLSLFLIGESFTANTSPMQNLYLIRELHFSLSAIGLVNKSMGLIATFMGGMAAGFCWKKSHTGLLYPLLLGLQSFSALALFTLSYAPSHVNLAVVTLIDQLVLGMSITTLLSLLMGFVRGETYVATQLAILTGLTALPKLLVGPWLGFLVEHHGFAPYFLLGITLPLLNVGVFVMLWKRDAFGPHERTLRTS